MQFFTTVLALSGAAFVAAQGETRLLTPTGAAPAGCTGTVDGKFKITLYDVSGAAAPAKRDLEKRQAGPVECSGAEGSLEVQVEGGILTDSKGRIGSIISANRQFQFDGPPAQAGALYTGGWSICNNGSLAIGPNANFYRCRSGNFANLYDQPSESECELVAIGVLPCSGSTIPAGSSAAVSSAAETTPAASVSTYAASSAAASTPAGSEAASAPAPSAPAITQIGDGQIQYPTGAVPTMISEISDGQVQAPTVPAVPAPSAPSAVVSQISDGQVQFPTGTAAPAPSAPAANGTISAPSPPIATGAASLNTIASGLVAVVAGVVAVAML